MATPEIKPVEKKQRDAWDKADILFKLVGPLITAVIIAWLGYQTSSYLKANDEKDAKTKLYTELMGRREEAESSIRKDMFNSIMSNFLKDKSSLDERLLQLELLTYNFHESLNLMPLFEYTNRIILQAYKGGQIRYEERKALLERLYKMAREVSDKQIAGLERYTTPSTLVYTDSAFKNDPLPVAAVSEDSTDFIKFHDSIPRGKKWVSLDEIVHLEVLSYDTLTQNVRVRMTIQTQVPGEPDKIRTPEFYLNYFEFPMIDNTRVEKDMRIAIVLTSFNQDDLDGVTENTDGTACLNPKVYHRFEFRVLYFPGANASMNTKTDFDDIVSKLISQ